MTMSELPKAGEEWFHRESLTVARVLHVRPETENIKVVVVASCVGGCCQRFDDSVDDFLRDYARNEPVTLELLERMGWEACEGQAVRMNFAIDSHGFDKLEIEPDRESWSLSVSLTTDGGGCNVEADRQLAPVRTLRDLLNVLRVFGVESSVPPAPAENPTA